MSNVTKLCAKMHVKTLFVAHRDRNVAFGTFLTIGPAMCCFISYLIPSRPTDGGQVRDMVLKCSDRLQLIDMQTAALLQWPTCAAVKGSRTCTSPAPPSSSGHAALHGSFHKDLSSTAWRCSAPRAVISHAAKRQHKRHGIRCDAAQHDRTVVVVGEGLFGAMHHCVACTCSL